MKQLKDVLILQTLTVAKEQGKQFCEFENYFKMLVLVFFRRPTTTTQAPIIDPQCRDIEDGLLVRNPFSCSSFYECLNGRAMPRFCDDDLWFVR
jgi:Chitin binding Peritrophin-A domain